MKANVIFLFVFACVAYSYAVGAVRIAIVGGGVGGTASAYFLKQLMSDALVDVFEAGTVGGRLAVSKMGGREYEAGGAIIHPRNLLMKKLVKDLGLSKRKEQHSGNMGLYNGQEFLFTESSSSLLTTLKLFWRYGLSLLSLSSLTDKKLSQFERIYGHLDKGASFRSVKSLLESMTPSFVFSTEISAEKGFVDAGLSEKLVNELVAATIRVNYGQTLADVHEFVGFVSVAGADGGLWSVEGGNYQVPRNLLQHSGAALIPHRVLSVEAEEQGGYNVTWQKGDFTETERYDAVVIATPLTGDYKQQISLPELDHPLPERHMHRLFVTFVQGTFNYSTFGITKEDGVDDVIALWDNPWFNSVSRVNPVNGSTLSDDETPVYKVFSNYPLSMDQLDQLFLRRDAMMVHDWFAYPEYNHTEELEGKFDLRPGLFYVNAIEWAASAMEMSAMAAKNVAILTRNHLRPHEEQHVDITSGASKLEL